MFGVSKLLTRGGKSRPSFREENGFTLLEVLVAMLILAIGLLGVAAMQMRGLQYNHDAYLRSQVSVLAYDIADRIRLNRANAGSYVGNYTVPATAPTGCTDAGASAINDLACWRRQVFDAIPPNSTANITAASDEYTVTLTWQNRDGTDRAVAYTFVP